MKKILNSMFLALLLTAVAYGLSGCSKDDEKNAVDKVTVQDKPNGNDNQDAKSGESVDNNDGSDSNVEPNVLESAANELGDNLAELNFDELKPLYEVVTTTPTAPTRGLSDELPAFQKKLAQLLIKLRSDFNISLPFGQRFSYQSMNDALSLAFDLSGTIEANRENGSSWFGLNKNKKGEVSYIANDGSVYDITAEVKKETYVKFRGFKSSIVVEKVSELYIKKDGKQILRILSGCEKDRPVWLPLLIKTDFFTGQVCYRDFEVGLAYNKNSTHSRTIDLTYGKSGEEASLLTMSAKLEDDADLLKIIKHDVNVEASFRVEGLQNSLALKGYSNNINYLVMNASKIINSLEGLSSEAECNALVNGFNSNLSLAMDMKGESLGKIYMITKYNETTGKYEPLLVLNSEMLGGEILIDQILAMLGVSLRETLTSLSQSV
jgi:hypothetical protein